MARARRLSKTVRMVIAVAGGAAFFGAAGLLAGQATGVPRRGGPDVVASPSSPGPSSPAPTTPPGSDDNGAAVPSVVTTTAGPRPSLGTKVAIVGDSLTEGVRTRLVPFASRYGFDAKIDAQNGRDIESGLAPLKKVSTDRDLVVVALGTNDARAGLKPEDARARIDEVLAQVAGKPVLWVNVYRADTKGTTTAADVFDTELTAAAGRYPNLTVLDWASYIRTRPELMGADHIHLTSPGYDARAEWLARQIAAGLRLPLPDAPEINR